MTRWSAPSLLLAACVSDADLGDIATTPVRPAQESGVSPEPGDTRVEERFAREPAGAVDVLWVVDNSVSMAEEQAQLAANFATFLTSFEDTLLDWQVGVITTDMEDPAHRGRLREVDGRRWIDADTPSAHAVFAEMVRVGTRGAIDEAGFDAVHAALAIRDDDYNAGFRRADAALQVVVVSDEDDSSQLGLNAFIAWFEGLDALDRLGFSAIVTPLEGCEAGAVPGLAYQAAARLFGGVQASICSPRWGETIDSIGRVAAGLEPEFLLDGEPRPATLQVTIERGDGPDLLDQPGDWTYDGLRNSVVIHTVLPAPGETVVVSYLPRG